MKIQLPTSQLFVICLASFGLLTSSGWACGPTPSSSSLERSVGTTDISVEEVLVGTRLGTILRTDVARILDLSNYLKKRIRETFESNAKPPSGSGNIPSFVSDGMIKEVLRGKLADTEAKIVVLLSETRLARLDQLKNQLKGVQFLYEKDTLRTLNLTREQRAKFDLIRKQFSGEKTPDPEKERRSLVGVLSSNQMQTLNKFLGPMEVFDSVPKYIVELPRIRR